MPATILSPKELLDLYIGNLKDFNFNDDRSLLFSFDFEEEMAGTFSVNFLAGDETYHGSFRITRVGTNGPVHLSMLCIGFYIGPQLRIETMTTHQSHNYKIELNRYLSDLPKLHVRLKTKRNPAVRRFAKRIKINQD